MMLIPRLQLIEIADQPWCPSWLREHLHTMLAEVWGMRVRGRKSSPADEACDIMIENIPDSSSFTFIDVGAGAGGPTPMMEPTLNEKFRAQGKSPVRFVLADLYPNLEAWKKIVKHSDYISYIEHPVDATKVAKYTEQGEKECRIFNQCFHHFDDPSASVVLRSAIESSDAFMYVFANANTFHIKHTEYAC
jgi:hypothetical protein